MHWCQGSDDDFRIMVQRRKPALLIGNEINQFKDSETSSWKDQLNKLAAFRSPEYSSSSETP